jgi:hypothetical protein
MPPSDSIVGSSQPVNTYLNRKAISSPSKCLIAYCTWSTAVPVNVHDLASGKRCEVRTTEGSRGTPASDGALCEAISLPMLARLLVWEDAYGRTPDSLRLSMR